MDMCKQTGHNTSAFSRVTFFSGVTQGATFN